MNDALGNGLGDGTILSQSNIRLRFMFIVFDLSPEAIATLNKIANEQGVSRSELVERYVKNIEPLLDATETVLLDASSENYCFPPHPSYSVDGEAIRQLRSAYETLNL
ncbi:MAG TPA: CopG family transcriptional regulator [Cyanophyceae cyanobacterium]